MMSASWFCVRVCRHVAPWVIAAYAAVHPVPVASCEVHCHWAIPPAEFAAGGMFGGVPNAALYDANGGVSWSAGSYGAAVSAAPVTASYAPVTLPLGGSPVVVPLPPVTVPEPGSAWIVGVALAALVLARKWVR